MKRPVTIFTGQWADLGMEEMCETAEKMGMKVWKSPHGDSWMSVRQIPIPLISNRCRILCAGIIWAAGRSALILPDSA